MIVTPYKGIEPYIFLSYSHKDKTAVLDIVEHLYNNGYNVWFDEGIDPGTEWDENIASHITGCSYFIGYITENYIESQNCRDEITFARDLNKDRLLIYGEDVELPQGMKMRLNRLQAIHRYKYANQDNFFAKLYQAHGIDTCRGKAASRNNMPAAAVTPQAAVLSQKKHTEKQTEGKPAAETDPQDGSTGAVSSKTIIISIAVIIALIAGVVLFSKRVPVPEQAVTQTNVSNIDIEDIEYTAYSHEGITIEIPSDWIEEPGSSYLSYETLIRDREYAYRYYEGSLGILAEVARSGYEDNKTAKAHYKQGAQALMAEQTEGLENVTAGEIEIDGTTCFWYQHFNKDSEYTSPAGVPEIWTYYYIPVDKEMQITEVVFIYAADDNASFYEELQKRIVSSISINR